MGQQLRIFFINSAKKKRSIEVVIYINANWITSVLFTVKL
jgi:hypothetical protein